MLIQEMLRILGRIFGSELRLEGIGHFVGVRFRLFPCHLSSLVNMNIGSVSTCGITTSTLIASIFSSAPWLARD